MLSSVIKTERSKLSVSINGGFFRAGTAWGNHRHVSFKIRVPRVILLVMFDRLPKKEVKFTRHNIFERDRNTCQYCGRIFERKDLNLDHVIPRDRGGPTTWENIVCSCIRCNTQKANCTPAEAGMHLVRKPKRPKWRPFVQVNLGLPTMKVGSISWTSLTGTWNWRRCRLSRNYAVDNRILRKGAKPPRHCGRCEPSSQAVSVRCGIPIRILRLRLGSIASLRFKLDCIAPAESQVLSNSLTLGGFEKKYN